MNTSSKFLSLALGSVFFQVIGHISNLTIAATVSTYEYGALVYWISTLTLVSTLLMLGFPQLLTREILLEKLPLSVITKYLLISLILCALVGVGLVFFKPQSYHYIPLLFILVTNSYLSLVFQANDQHERMLYPYAIISATRVIPAIIIVFVAFQLSNLFFIVSSVMALVALYILYSVIHKMSIIISTEDLKPRNIIFPRKIIYASLPFLTSSIAFNFYNQSPIYVLGYVDEMELAGSYALANLFCTAVTMLLITYYNKVRANYFYKLDTDHERLKVARKDVLRNTILACLVLPAIAITYSFFEEALASFKYPHFKDFILLIAIGTVLRFCYFPFELYYNLESKIVKKNWIVCYAALISFTSSILLVYLDMEEWLGFVFFLTEVSIFLGFIYFSKDEGDGNAK